MVSKFVTASNNLYLLESEKNNANSLLDIISPILDFLYLHIPSSRQFEHECSCLMQRKRNLVILGTGMQASNIFFSSVLNIVMYSWLSQRK